MLDGKKRRDEAWVCVSDTVNWRESDRRREKKDIITHPAKSGVRQQHQPTIKLATDSKLHFKTHKWYKRDLHSCTSLWKKAVFHIRSWNKWKVNRFIFKVQEIPDLGHSLCVVDEEIRQHIQKRIESAPKRITSLVTYCTLISFIFYFL